MDDLCTVELRDAEVRLPELVSRVEDGDEILITRGNRPAALLVGLADDFIAEDELVWEGEIRLTAETARSGEVTLYASIG